jgi:hypothetical protein
MDDTFHQIAISSVQLNQLQSEMQKAVLAMVGEMLECLAARKPATLEQIQAWKAIVDASLRRLPELDAELAKLSQEIASLSPLDS